MAKNTKKIVKRLPKQLTEQQIAQATGGEVLAVMNALRASGYSSSMGAACAAYGYEEGGRVCVIF